MVDDNDDNEIATNKIERVDTLFSRGELGRAFRHAHSSIANGGLPRTVCGDGPSGGFDGVIERRKFGHAVFFPQR